MIEILQLLPALLSLILELWKTVKYVEKEFKGEKKGREKKAAILEAVSMAYRAARAMRNGKDNPEVTLHKTAGDLVDSLVFMLNGNGGFKKNNGNT